MINGLTMKQHGTMLEKVHSIIHRLTDKHKVNTLEENCKEARDTALVLLGHIESVPIVKVEA